MPLSSAHSPTSAGPHPYGAAHGAHPDPARLEPANEVDLWTTDPAALLRAPFEVLPTRTMSPNRQSNALARLALLLTAARLLLGGERPSTVLWQGGLAAVSAALLTLHGDERSAGGPTGAAAAAKDKDAAGEGGLRAHTSAVLAQTSRAVLKENPVDPTHGLADSGDEEGYLFPAYDPEDNVDDADDHDSPDPTLHDQARMATGPRDAPTPQDFRLADATRIYARQEVFEDSDEESSIINTVNTGGAKYASRQR